MFAVLYLSQIKYGVWDIRFKSFNARQLFRPFGNSSVASKSSFFLLVTYAEQILNQASDICVDLSKFEQNSRPPIQKERDRLQDFKAQEPPPFREIWDFHM